MPHSVNAPQGSDTGLSSLLLLARYFGVPADGEQLKHEFGETGKSFDEVGLLRIAKHLGFKTRAIDSDWSRLSAISLPAIAQNNNGHYIVIARADDEKLLIHDPLELRPLTLPRELFEESWSGRLLLFTKRSNVRNEDRKFDFTWFIPAIVKHRKLLGEVLLASFFIQLFALLMPLFFQAVIDKVLVHKGITTLHVLAIGMLAITIFEVLLGGL